MSQNLENILNAINTKHIAISESDRKRNNEILSGVSDYFDTLVFRYMKL